MSDTNDIKGVVLGMDGYSAQLARQINPFR